MPLPRGSQAYLVVFNDWALLPSCGFGIHEDVLKGIKRALLSAYGYSCRLSNIVAAIGKGGPHKVLDGQAILKRELFREYQDKLGGLNGLGFAPEENFGRSSRWLT